MTQFCRRSRKIPSSFKGRISEIPEVCVDNFENPSMDGAKAYFLSHFHTDHIVGLDESALRDKLVKEKNVFVYATKITAAIIVYNNYDLEDYVKVLNLGTNLIAIPGDSVNQSDFILNVTLIPAGHCLGSTMFLFETTSVKVLYTGDFRIRSNDLTKYAAFHTIDGDVIKLDTLYVDTTFIDTHMSFPKRKDSIEEVIILIRGYLEIDKDQNVILDTSATYGYEYVFNQIYKLLKMKVYVDDKKWSFYNTIQHLVPGVTNNLNETRIFLRSVPETRETRLPPKGIRFSAIRWDDWNEDKTSVNEKGNYVYVCFSTHCSRTELISFVEYLNAVKVVGFPKPYIVKSTTEKEAEVRSDSEEFKFSPKKTPKKHTCSLNKPYQKDKKVDGSLLRKLFR